MFMRYAVCHQPKKGHARRAEENAFAPICSGMAPNRHDSTRNTSRVNTRASRTARHRLDPFARLVVSPIIINPEILELRQGARLNRLANGPDASSAELVFPDHERLRGNGRAHALRTSERGRQLLALCGAPPEPRITEE